LLACLCLRCTQGRVRGSAETHSPSKHARTRLADARPSNPPPPQNESHTLRAWCTRGAMTSPRTTTCTMWRQTRTSARSRRRAGGVGWGGVGGRPGGGWSRARCRGF
jgi:hypothetical protein